MENYPIPSEESAAWNKIVEDAFAPDAPNHVFSKRYQKKKKKMEQQLLTGRKIRSMRKKPLTVAVAVVAAVVLIPSSAFATSRIYTAYMEQSATYQREITIQEGDTVSTSPMALCVDWMPEDLSLKEGDSHMAMMKYANADWSRAVSICFLKIPDGAASLQETVKGAVDSETYTANGNTVIQIQTNQAWEDPFYLLWVAFPDTAYVAKVYVMGDLTQEECRTIASHLSLEACEEEVASTWTDADAVEEEDAPSVSADTTIQGDRARILSVGDSVETTCYGEDGVSSSVDVAVTRVTLQTNFDGIDTDDIGRAADYRAYTDAEGNIVDNVRTWYREGDGVETLATQMGQETQSQSILVVEMTYTNTGRETVECCVCPDFYLQDENGDFIRPVDAVATPDACYYEDSLWELKVDQMAFSFATQHTYHKNNLTALQAGETATVQLAYLVDTDAVATGYLHLTQEDGAAFVALSEHS